MCKPEYPNQIGKLRCRHYVSNASDKFAIEWKTPKTIITEKCVNIDFFKSDCFSTNTCHFFHQFDFRKHAVTKNIYFFKWEFMIFNECRRFHTILQLEFSAIPNRRKVKNLLILRNNYYSSRMVSVRSMYIRKPINNLILFIRS